MIPAEKPANPSIDEATILSGMFAQPPPNHQNNVYGFINVTDLQPGAPYKRDHCSGYEYDTCLNDRSRFLDVQLVGDYHHTADESHNNGHVEIPRMPKMWEIVKNAFAVPY